MVIEVRGLSELSSAAKSLLEFSSGEKIFLFYGEMGAGKTTLIKSLSGILGTHDNPASPTYSIVNEYRLPDDKIYHFDFYRIKSETEAYDIGFEEYLSSGNYCFIEWPERIESLWPEHYVRVVIEENDSGGRTITCTRT